MRDIPFRALAGALRGCVLLEYAVEVMMMSCVFSGIPFHDENWCGGTGLKAYPNLEGSQVLEGIRCEEEGMKDPLRHCRASVQHINLEALQLQAGRSTDKKCADQILQVVPYCNHRAFVILGQSRILYCLRAVLLSG
jgi:hypothetical protein